MSPAIVLLLAVSAVAHPTMYKLNENSKFEPDLVPVSSTVIPLPIYQVGYGIKVAPGLNGRKSVIERPEGPITLITAHSKRRLWEMKKKKRRTKNANVIVAFDIVGWEKSANI